MTAFSYNLNIQTAIALFFLVLCLTLFILGYLLWRFEFLNGKEFFFSRTLGAVLMVVSIILALTSLLMLLFIRITL